VGLVVAVLLIVVAIVVIVAETNSSGGLQLQNNYSTQVPNLITQMQQVVNSNTG
jgi:hypothetical protein